MSILEFFTTVNGIAELWAANEQFLGILSSDQDDPYSISNLDGIFGSLCGIYSIRNSAGLYGSPSGIYSPYNTECLKPPIVYFQGQPALIVTKNSYYHKQVDGLPVVDPDLLLEVYTKRANTGKILNSSQPFVKIPLFSDLANSSTQLLPTSS
ncbi:hypothetical protein NIES4074_27400 [Cylindrospermum sp. NIES-4074]|nr:hypothetical protein NIES4074_27400 [Cylindrospermum sp. NIES-4074]